MNTQAPPFVVASSALPVGTRLGEFEITGVVGEGGFGIVYSAHDSSLDRIVAIKEYLPTAFSGRTTQGLVQVKSEVHRKTFEMGLSSFINEAKLLAKFSHPGLVEVFRFWEANGTAYMAMRYYRGVTLRELLRTSPELVTEQWLCQTLDPILLALFELHSEKCYHRDIAPDNILVLPNGRSVLMDFGAARRIISGMTQALTVVLKPGYAPIEQYDDDGAMPQGAWTDIYAVGGLLYHLMTGKVPVQAISRMISDPLKPVADLARGSYSKQLCDVVMKCLAVLPANRYQDIDELRAALGWVSTPGQSTLVRTQPVAVPVERESESTVVLSGPAVLTPASGPVATRAGVGATDLLASASALDPMEMTKEPEKASSSAGTRTSQPAKPADSSASPVEPAKPGKALLVGALVAVVLVLCSTALFFGRAKQTAETKTDATAPIAGVPDSVSDISRLTASAGTAAEPVPMSDQRQPGAGTSPAAAVASPTGMAAATRSKQPVAPSGSVGTVRFELKNGWGTVFVDGENKGTAPPVIVVNLSGGIHQIELRNPALATVRRTVEVIPGKTIVVRHTFGK